MRVGSLVICLVAGNWYCKHTDDVVPGPKKDETTVVAGIDEDGDLVFEEYQILNIKGNMISYERIYFKELQPPLDIELLITEKISL